MKKLFTLLLAMVSASGSLFAQTSGGPDSYGYVWRNNTDPSGPAYKWYDLSTPGSRYAGTQINDLGDDNESSFINMGFSMKYYWTDVTRLKVGANGYIRFTSTAKPIADPFVAIPTNDRVGNFAGAYITDLFFNPSDAGVANPGRAYYYTNNVDTMIISYENVPYWVEGVIPGSSDFTGSNTFQIILSKLDNGITFQYKNMSANPRTSAGVKSVIGIENVTETIGVEVTPLRDVVPANNTAIKFYRPASSTLQVTDLQVNWSDNERNAAFFTMKGQPMTITGNVSNVGNTNMSNPFTIRTIVRTHPASQIRFNNVLTLPKLRQGTDTTYSYPTTFTPTAEGPYTITASLTATGDVNSSNNASITEFAVIDTSGKKREVTLLYNDGIPEGITSFGAAVYYKPPFYPTEVRSIDAFLLSFQGATASTNTFNVRLYAEDPTTGGLGTILFDSLLSASSLTLNALNSVEIPLKKLKMITSGGFYAAWIPVTLGGVNANTFVAVDETLPASFRTYEFQGGNITDYRSGASEDFMINVSIGTKILSPDGISKDKNSLFAFDKVYPNPASDKVTFEYNLKTAAPVEFTITNVIGSKVKMVNAGKKASGAQKEVLNVADLKAGVYFCTMKVGDTTVTKRLVVTK